MNTKYERDQDINKKLIQNYNNRKV